MIVNTREKSSQVHLPSLLKVHNTEDVGYIPTHKIAGITLLLVSYISYVSTALPHVQKNVCAHKPEVPG